jgi:hypothetical protein
VVGWEGQSFGSEDGDIMPSLDRLTDMLSISRPTFCSIQHDQSDRIIAIL